MHEQGDTALISAAYSGHAEAVNLLLERGAVVDMKMKDGMTPLMKAAAMGADCLSNCRYDQVVKSLLAKGADPNAKNNKEETPLMLASCATYDNIDIVRMLLDRGAKVNAKKPNAETILMCAAERGHRDVVKLLLERGSDPNARRQDGMTAIKLSVKRWGWQADEIVKILKQAGARE
jgi:ankyrin repeat protein